MQSIRLPIVLDALSAAERTALLEKASLQGLSDIFAAVPDPRSRHGQRYTLPFLLTCLVAALLCNCNSMDAVGQWCREHRSLVRRALGPRRFLTPTGSLYRRLLPRLSVPHLEGAISAWLQASRPQPDPEAVALDGKTLRRAAAADEPKPHLLSIATHQTRETLVQVRVADQTNEIPVAQALLAWVPLAGRVVTADALHGHPAFAQAVLDQGGDYLLCLKANEPHAHDALIQYFADSDAVTTQASTRDRQHGRIERRTLRASTELNDYLTTFPALAQVAEVTRVVQKGEKVQREVRYYLTSCPCRQVDAAAFLGLVRAHWSIESGHWIRDEVFGEDRCQIRTGHAPQILAALRNLVVTLIRRTGTAAITATRRHFAAHPAQALALLRRKARSLR
jgi:predicted transposase YbfD/YdcC